ncbi:MAG: chloride channel protein [Candidatus Heimdallarchaeota archaeon]
MRTIELHKKTHKGLQYALQMFRQAKLMHIVGLAIITGLFGGIGAVVFRFIIQLNNQLFFGIPTQILSTSIVVFIAPILGGLLIGQITSRVAWETKGHGVPEIMEAVTRGHGVIRPRVPFAKVIASGINIGSGGSCGREGPIAQIGAGFGSILGVKMHLNERELRTLVVAGVAAGIAATFNAPLGGLLFGIELILFGRLTSRAFIPLCLAVVTGMIVSTHFLGDKPAFVVPAYRLGQPIELLFYLLLGLICGLVSVGWIHSFYMIEDLFEKLPLRNALKPALGGFFVGLIALMGFPEVQGVGYETIEQAITSNMLVETLLLLCIFKLIATACTIGSGGSGGVFAPSLFIGAMLGAAYGHFVTILFPGTHSGAYAVVAMAALFAGAARAPLTVIFMTMELTGDYLMILPLMGAVSLSYLVSAALSGDNIYTLKLLRRGIDLLHHPQHQDALDIVKVEEAMRKKEETLYFHPNDTTEHIKTCYASGKYVYKRYPVLDQENNHLLGLITLTQMMNAIEKDPTPESKSIEDYMIKESGVIVTYADETLHDALDKLILYGVNSLPVLARKREKNSEFVGILSRTDILVALEKYVSAPTDVEEE